MMTTKKKIERERRLWTKCHWLLLMRGEINPLKRGYRKLVCSKSFFFAYFFSGSSRILINLEHLE